jgi:hypothetical protein
MLATEPGRRPAAAVCVVEAGKLLRGTIEGTPVGERVEVKWGESAGLGGGEDDDDAEARAERNRRDSEQEPEGSKKQRQAGDAGQGPVEKKG